MRIADLITAFDLPAGTLVEQRIPKKILVENGAPTTIDKRRINEGIEIIQWHAALKPTTIGVPAYRDEVREYLEIAILSVTLRPGAKAERLAELIHRAVPYPVVLMMVDKETLTLSLTHKRWSQGEAGKTVLDGDLVSVELSETAVGGLANAFLRSLPLSCQPRATLSALYQGWIDAVHALQAARVSGVFTIAASPDKAEIRRDALQECGVLEIKIASLRSAAMKEKQINRQVELNLELKRLQAAQTAAREKL